LFIAGTSTLRRVADETTEKVSDEPGLTFFACGGKNVLTTLQGKNNRT
jgi:hypothetical protein